MEHLTVNFLTASWLFLFFCLRNTRMMDNVFGDFKFLFIDTCIEVLNVLKKNKDQIFNFLESFWLDPLDDFYSPQNIDDTIKNENIRCENQRKSLNEALQTIRNRLNRDQNSTQDQVRELTRNSTDVLNLARMYPGWVALW